jgi:hypothetical protein
MKEQHGEKWTEYLELIKVTSNQHDIKSFFAKQSINAFMKKANKTSYFIASSIVEIVSSVLCNSSNDSNNWVKQFIVVDEDLVDAFNGQINFLKHNDDLFNTVIKNMKQLT